MNLINFCLPITLMLEYDVFNYSILLNSSYEMQNSVDQSSTKTTERLTHSVISGIKYTYTYKYCIAIDD